MGENNIHIKLRISKVQINKFFDDYLTQYSQQKITAESYEITLNKPENTSINIHTSANSSKLFLDIPLKFAFLKSAGLFSVEGEGAIMANIEIEYNILPDLSLSTSSTFLNYNWLQKPIVHLGNLNIPAEMLGDVIIHFMKDNLLTKFDNAIQENLDIKALLTEQWIQYATNYQLNQNPDLFLNARLNQITSRYLISDDTHLTLNLDVDMDLKISDKQTDIVPEFNPKFVWNNHYIKACFQDVFVELSYKKIAKIIISQLDGKEFGGKQVLLDSVHITKQSNLEIKASMTSPMTGLITIVCLPVFSKSTQMITLDNLDVNVKANNIIYKLVSPVLESAFTKKIQDLMPLNLTSFIEIFIKKVPKIQILNDQISIIPTFSTPYIESLGLLEDYIELCINIRDIEIEVTT